ncbi:MAG: hypothetical protein ACT4PG_08600 [Panacagrimonas sp.]
MNRISGMSLAVLALWLACVTPAQADEYRTSVFADPIDEVFIAGLSR